MTKVENALSRYSKKDIRIIWCIDNDNNITDFIVAPSGDAQHNMALYGQFRGKHIKDIGNHCMDWEKVTLADILTRLCRFHISAAMRKHLLRELSKVEEWHTKTGDEY